jgi:hypothetical protein
MTESIIKGIEVLCIDDIQEVLKSTKRILDEKYEIHNKKEITDAEENLLLKLYRKYRQKCKDKNLDSKYVHDITLYEELYNKLYPIDKFVLIYNHTCMYECHYMDSKSCDDRKVYIQLFTMKGWSPTIVCEDCFNMGSCPDDLSPNVDFNRILRIIQLRVR